MTTRSQRGRLLLVGNGKAEQIAHRLGDRAAHARNPIFAVGELATAPAQNPFEMIVLSESTLQGVSQHPVRELRRLDPSVRIGLVKDANGTEAQQSVGVLRDQEFDMIFQDWPSVEELSRIQRHERAQHAEANTPQAGAERKAIAEATSDTPDRMPQETQVEEPAKKATPPAKRPSLGDVDLVRAVIAGEGAAALALELIRQHTGWTDIHYQPKAHADNDVGMLIRFGDRTLGSLHSKQAPARELQRWADWLAYWLALDADHRTLRDQSYRDDLTGAWNRRYFNEYLTETIKIAARKRIPVSVMVFDLDDFKKYNDEFGHAAGDEILRETVRMLNSVIRKTDRVCRIGGDEFAVIFADTEGPREKGSTPPETVEQLAQRFQDQVCKMNFPKLGIEAPGTLSVSAGLATFPWDGWEPEKILQHADELALQSKRKGKNVLTLGQGAQKVCRPQE